jgi:hypothetical protein
VLSNAGEEGLAQDGHHLSEGDIVPDERWHRSWCWYWPRLGIPWLIQGEYVGEAAGGGVPGGEGVPQVPALP